MVVLIPALILEEEEDDDLLYGCRCKRHFQEKKRKDEGY